MIKGALRGPSQLFCKGMLEATSVIGTLSQTSAIGSVGIIAKGQFSSHISFCNGLGMTYLSQSQPHWTVEFHTLFNVRLPEGEPSPRNTQSIPKEPAASQPQHWEAFIRGVLESSLGHRAADAAQDTFDANDGSREVGCWAAGWKWRCLSRWPVQISNILNLCLECVNTLIHDKGMFEGLTLDKPLFYQRPFRLAHSHAAHTMPGV